MPQINEFFTADHQKLDSLYTAFKKCISFDESSGVKYFQKFKTQLINHIHWEESILFPLIEKLNPASMGPTMVMCSEHELIISLLTRIDKKLQHNDTQSLPEVDELESILNTHNMKEESILYPMIDKHINEQQLVEVFSAIAIDEA